MAVRSGYTTSEHLAAAKRYEAYGDDAQVEADVCEGRAFPVGMRAHARSAGAGYGYAAVRVRQAAEELPASVANTEHARLWTWASVLARQASACHKRGHSYLVAGRWFAVAEEWAQRGRKFGKRGVRRRKKSGA